MSPRAVCSSNTHRGLPAKGPRGWETRRVCGPPPGSHDGKSRSHFPTGTEPSSLWLLSHPFQTLVPRARGHLLKGKTKLPDVNPQVRGQQLPLLPPPLIHAVHTAFPHGSQPVACPSHLTAAWPPASSPRAYPCPLLPTELPKSLIIKSPRGTKGPNRPPLACPCPHRSASSLAASSLPTPVVLSLLLGTDQAPNSPSRPRASPSSRGTSVLLGEPTAHFCPRDVYLPQVRDVP